jgi:O-antigen ligase
VNCAAYILQELDRWPFWQNVEGEKHLSRTAFIGNPNDVGSYLIAPALVAAALALSQRRFRAAWAGAALLLAATTFVTQTVAAIGALVVALIVMAGLWLRSWPKFGAALLAIGVAAAIAVSVYPPLRQRAAVMREALAQRDYETFSAARTVPFLAAANMAADHPLLGVGPGCFAYNYFEYKIRLQQRHRWVFGPNMSLDNYGETHNDHLQTLAETGFPGYALLLAALVLLGSGSLPRASGGDEYVRLVALPLAAGFFVLALAQFPLEIAAPAHAFLWAAASVAAWRQW